MKNLSTDLYASHRFSPHNKTKGNTPGADISLDLIFIGFTKTEVEVEVEVWRHHFANFSIGTFKPHHVVYTPAEERVQNFNSLALLKVKIEKYEVLHSPILTSLI